MNLQIACMFANGGIPLDMGGANGLIPYISTLGGVTDNAFIGVGGGVYGVCALVPNLFMMMGMSKDISGLVHQTDIYPLGLQCCATGTGNGSSSQSTAIKAMKTAIEGAITAQEGVWASGAGIAGMIAYKVAERAERGSEGGLSGTDWWGPGKTSVDIITQKSRPPLKRNKQKIVWYGAKHTYISVPPIPIVLPPGLHVHMVQAEKVDESDKSWYILEGNEKTAACGSITVTATRAANEKSNLNYPLASEWLGIDWGTIYVIAKALWANTTGNVGFPVHQSPFEDKDLLTGDVLKDPVQAYKGNDDPPNPDFADEDGWNGSRWFAQMVKTDFYLH
jgi:hypothetical protein